MTFDPFRGTSYSAEVVQQTSTQWAATGNFVLQSFQIGIETDTGKAKLGDGATEWSDLGYWSPNGGPPIQSAVLQSDFAKTNDTLAAVTDLTLNLEAGKWYRVTGQLSSTTGAGGGRAVFAGGSVALIGAQGASWSVDVVNATISALANFAFAGLSSTVDFGNNASDPVTIYVDFTIQVDTAGTLIVQYAQTATDAAASTLLKYSTIQAVDVTPV